MDRTDRWTAAQDYEREWWDSRKDRIDFDFYRTYASELLRQMEGIRSIASDTSILEIGSGAGGIITYLDSEDRHAVDPLEEFYASVPRFRRLRDGDVSYRAAKAEDLPYPDNRFDLIINDNVLDHCEDVQGVFLEMRRVLRRGGAIYLRLNRYTRWGRGIRRIVEIGNIDPGHPHTLTAKAMRILIRESGFQILKEESNGFLRTWWKEIRSLEIKEWLKAVTLSTPDKTLYILKKTAESGEE